MMRRQLPHPPGVPAATGSQPKPCASMWSGRSSGALSLPSARLIAISHTLAVLTSTSLAGSASAARAVPERPGVVGQPPQHRVGVDEQPGHALYSAKSSGVSSKSSAIVISPLSAPGTRGVVGGW